MEGEAQQTTVGRGARAVNGPPLVHTYIHTSTVGKKQLNEPLRECNRILKYNIKYCNGTKLISETRPLILMDCGDGKKMNAGDHLMCSKHKKKSYIFYFGLQK
jgi:hypothetical protein